MILIGLTGHKEAGKTTIANYLQSKSYKRMSFAKPLKEASKILFGLTDHQVYVDKEQKDEYWGYSPRKILQVLGTEMFQFDIHEHLPRLCKPRHFWTELFKKRLEARSLPRVVVDDVRFIHEAEAIREMGGVVIRVFNDFVDGKTYTHKSETELENINYDYALQYDICEKNYERYRRTTDVYIKEMCDEIERDTLGFVRT